MDFYNPNREVSRIENAPEETAGRTKLKDSEYLCLRKGLSGIKGMRIGISAPVVIILSAIMLIKLCRIGSLCKDCSELYQLWMSQRKEAIGMRFTDRCLRIAG